MQPIEFRARREALGLSQPVLARLLGNAQSTVAQWEAGNRTIPADAIDALDSMEVNVNDLVELALDGLEMARESGQETAFLQVWRDDAAFWQAHPDLDGLPAVAHRVAMARARSEFDDGEFEVRLCEVPE